MDECLEEVEDSNLLELCLKFGTPEAYRALRDHGITSENFCYLEETDINDILPTGAVKIIFRREWRQYVKLLKEEQNLDRCQTRREEPRASLWASISIGDVLLCPEGVALKEFYHRNAKLDKKRRKLLIDLILDHADSRGVTLSCRSIEILSEDICVIFPGEDKGEYYVPKSTTRKSYGGKLYCAYRNRKTKMKKGFHSIDNKAPEDKHLSGVEEDEDNIDITTIKLRLKNIGNSRDFSDEILCNWRATVTLRLQDRADGKNLLEEWPLYAVGEINHILIHEDFGELYPTSENIETKWTETLQQLISFLQENIKDKQNRREFGDLNSATNESKKENSVVLVVVLAMYLSSTDDRQCRILLLMHSVLKPRGFLERQGKNKVQKCKPTISDSQNSMLIVLGDENAIERQIAAFVIRLRETKRGFHPFIIKVGDIYRVYVTEDVFHLTDTVRSAIDTCFKTIHVLYKGIYPMESSSVWYFIQKHFYNLNLDDAEYIGRCTDIFDFLN